MNRNIHPVPLAFSLLVGLCIWFFPTPEGLPTEGQRVLAIFIGTVVAIITRVLPMGATAMIGLAVALGTDTISLQTGFGAFGKELCWRIVLAFFIARGFIKTGLGARISYHFVRLVGQRTLGLSYALLGSELMLAPAIPSNTARAGGVIFPILRSLALSFESFPNHPSSGRIGNFLTLTAFQGSAISSAMFMTAMAGNPLAASLAEGLGIEISWGLWAIAAIVPGLTSLTLMPLVIYWLFPPEVRQTPDAKAWAEAQLKEVGPMHRHEWIMAATFILLLVLWVFGSYIGVHATIAAMLGLSILLLTGVLTWQDIKKEEGAWDTLVWFAILVVMASELTRTGFISWLSADLSGYLTGYSWPVAFSILTLVYFYSHYLFASNTAHISSLYAVCLAVALSVGTPPYLAALSLAFLSNLFGGLTHYSSAPAPLLFGSGYVKLGTWWQVGAILSVINLTIWGTVGLAWWKVLGLW